MVGPDGGRLAPVDNHPLRGRSRPRPGLAGKVRFALMSAAMMTSTQDRRIGC